MGKFLAIILSLILGAFAAILYLTNMGKGYGEKSIEIEATRLVEQANLIEVAIDVYKAKHLEVVLGDDINVPLFQPLIDEGLVKSSINEEINTSDYKWVYDSGRLVLKKLIVESDPLETCKKINNIRHNTPLTQDPPSCDTNPSNLACCFETTTP